MSRVVLAHAPRHLPPCLIFDVRQKQTMKPIIHLIFAACVVSSAFASGVIQKPGSYTSPQKTTSLQISDSPTPKAVFTFVHPDGMKTSVDLILSRDGAWACLLKDETTLWVYRKEDSFVRAISIFPPQAGEQIRTSTRKIEIESEMEAIPAELRSIIK